jgi:hypothetical protein
MHIMSKSRIVSAILALTGAFYTSSKIADKSIGLFILNDDSGYLPATRISTATWTTASNETTPPRVMDVVSWLKGSWLRLFGSVSQAGGVIQRGKTSHRVLNLI